MNKPDDGHYHRYGEGYYEGGSILHAHDNDGNHTHEAIFDGCVFVAYYGNGYVDIDGSRHILNPDGSTEVVPR